MEKVLIVDDEENIRFSFKSILTDEGFSVSEAADPKGARQLTDKQLFDVAIIDRLLKSEDGISLAESISRVQPCCSIILISAFPTFKSAARGIELGIFAYLEKPVKKSKLVSVVKAAAEKTDEKRMHTKLLDHIYTFSF